MKTISKFSDLLPGYVQLIVIPTQNISAIAQNTVNVISNDDVFLIQASNDSISHEAPMAENDHGKYFDHLVTATLQGYGKDQEDEIKSIYSGYVVLLMQTDDASWIRLGSTENPMNLIIDFSSAKPGFNLQFSGQLPYKSMPNVIPDY